MYEFIDRQPCIHLETLLTFPVLCTYLQERKFISHLFIKILMHALCRNEINKNICCKSVNNFHFTLFISFKNIKSWQWLKWLARQRTMTSMQCHSAKNKTPKLRHYFDVLQNRLKISITYLDVMYWQEIICIFWKQLCKSDVMNKVILKGFKMDDGRLFKTDASHVGLPPSPLSYH